MARILALFDVDGTLTQPRQPAEPETLTYLKTLRERMNIGIVGGSDFPKQQEQLGQDVLQNFDYVFSENGLMAFQQGTLIGKKTINEYLGEDNLKKVINWSLRYMSELELPVKRGTFIEYRTGMLNISPIGRNCSTEERNAFEALDNQHSIRQKMIYGMKREFQSLQLTYSIGGQISFDVFPKGWDKTFCLQYLTDYDEIHFFGDKTHPGGNDYEIFTHPRIIGHRVDNPQETLQLLETLF